MVSLNTIGSQKYNTNGKENEHAAASTDTIQCSLVGRYLSRPLMLLASEISIMGNSGVYSPRSAVCGLLACFSSQRRRLMN